MIAYKQLFPRIILFASSIPVWSFFSCRDYDYYFGQLPWVTKLCKVDIAHTKQIDLTQSIEDPLTVMRESTARKVRQGQKKIVIKAWDDIDLFINRYNYFARNKGLALISRAYLDKIPDENKCFYAAYIEEQEAPCAFMCYFFDDCRVRVLYSFTDFLLPENRNKASVGSLLLFYHGILYFKQQGKQVFDLGGYPIDADCPQMLGVNAFKDQFNGVLTPSYRIRSYWLVGLTQLVSLLQRLR